MNICPKRKSIEETKCWLLHDMYPSPNIAHFNIARYLIKHWRKYNRSKNFYYILTDEPYRRFYECFEVSVLYSIIFTKWLYAVIISHFEPGFQSSVNMPQGVAHWLLPAWKGQISRDNTGTDFANDLWIHNVNFTKNTGLSYWNIMIQYSHNLAHAMTDEPGLILNQSEH